MIDEKIIISNLSEKIILIHLIDGQAGLIKAYDYDELYDRLRIGSIVNCRITKRLEGINGSFLRYKKDGNGFINGDYKCETVHPFRYIKEGAGDKKPLFSNELEIAGKYSVIKLNGNNELKCSAKLSKSDRERLIVNYSHLLDEYSVSILLRTSSKEALKELVEAEIRQNASLLLDIIDKAATRTDGYVFYSPASPIIKDLSEIINNSFVEIVTDIKEIYADIETSLNNELMFAKDVIKLRFYEDKLLALNKLYRFEAVLSNALSRKVYLKDNAYITFDRTEALVAVDVNSSSLSLKNHSKEEANLKLNILAAREIVKQIILRNYSGIIIIDFVNMDSDESYNKLKDELNMLLGKDKLKSKFHGFTSLGLAEISRQRKELSLGEKMR